jgi:hypothetical protein
MSAKDSMIWFLNSVVAVVCCLFAREWMGAIGFSCAAVALLNSWYVGGSFENLARAANVMRSKP